MAKVIRKVIKIDEDLCTGCGKCVPACAEGAIQIIDGKARLVSDKYCDGLGACLGECPEGALSFEEREAEEFDEAAVAAHLGHPPAPGEMPPLSTGQCTTGTCPSARMFDFTERIIEEESAEGARPRSQLRQWPVKLSLLNPMAPYLKDADLLLAADCSAFACGSFHTDYLKGRIVAIGCPKFDDLDAYVEKLQRMITLGGIRSIRVLRMEVPCCAGLYFAAQAAVAASGKSIPLDVVVLSIRGETP